MSNQLTVAGNTAVSVSSAWGAESIQASDLLVPKILLMQGLSKMVSNEDINAKMGEFRNSLTGEMLGDAKNPVEVIIFQVQKTWINYEMEPSGKQTYIGTELMTPANENLLIDEIVNGIHIRRDKAILAYALLPTQIEAGEAFPYVISFKRTSFTAGRKLNTFLAMLRQAKKPIAAKTFKLMSTKKSNQKGTWYILDIATGRNTTEPELASAFEWYNLIAKMEVKVDESDVQSAETNDVSEVAAGF